MDEEQRSTILWKACTRRVSKRNTNFRFVQDYKQSTYSRSLKHFHFFKIENRICHPHYTV